MLDAHPAAVGEIGLDRWKEGLDYEGQEEVLKTNSVSLLSAIFRQHPLPKGMGANTRAAAGRPGLERALLHSYGGPTEMVQAFAQLARTSASRVIFARRRAPSRSVQVRACRSVAN